MQIHTSLPRLLFRSLTGFSLLRDFHNQLDSSISFRLAKMTLCLCYSTNTLGCSLIQRSQKWKYKNISASYQTCHGLKTQKNKHVDSMKSIKHTKQEAERISDGPIANLAENERSTEMSYLAALIAKKRHTEEHDEDEYCIKSVQVTAMTNIQFSEQEMSLNSTLSDLNLEDSGRDLQTKSSRSRCIRKLTWGSADVNEPVSGITCAGCGAILHCQTTDTAGFVPQEKYKTLDAQQLKGSVCQRCYVIDYHNLCLNVKAGPDDYPELISRIRRNRGLAVLVLDLTDFPNCIIKNLPELVSRHREFYIVGNKVDLLPKDSKEYLKKCKAQLYRYCNEYGIINIRHLCLVSAKTGYGIEQLVTKLLSDWDHSAKGDVYLLGCTNVGKSTLFNSLLSSDYCKSHVREVVHRATVSPWPGTTLNLLKFPIISSTGWRMYQRTQRLNNHRKLRKEEERERKEKLQKTGFLKYARLTGVIGQTEFKRPRQEKTAEEGEIVGGDGEFEGMIIPPSYTFTLHDRQLSAESKGDIQRYSDTAADKRQRKVAQRSLESLNSKWVYDTPGLINPRQVINLLMAEELACVLPKDHLQPRSYVLRPGQVMLLSGLARIDYLQGSKSIYFTVIASEKIPVHVKNTVHDADNFYSRMLGSPKLGVPFGDQDRLNKIPSLIGQEFHLTGVSWGESIADITLSSIGWVSISAPRGMPVVLRAYTPGAQGCQQRQPPLLPLAVNLRGTRINGTAAYRVRKKNKTF